MISWVSLLFEAGLATLMVALIFYCIKLNRRLSLLRNHNTEIADMIAGLRDASERAEQSVQRLKAAGISAERSLRSAIEDAAVARDDLARHVAASSQLQSSADQLDSTTSRPAGTSSSAPQFQTQPEIPGRPAADFADPPGRERVERDMLIGEPLPSDGPVPAPERPKTREEAEESVLQAIRSARAGA